MHVHNTDESLPTPSRFKHRLLLEPFRKICLHLSDKVVGISRDTLATFLKTRKPRPGRDVVCYYNIDESAFSQVHADRDAFRGQLGLNGDAKLLLCLGRMVALKNPVQAVDIMVEIMKANEDAFGIFAGEGDLLEDAKLRAEQLGMSQRFVFWAGATIPFAL